MPKSHFGHLGFFQNTFYQEHLWVTASGFLKNFAKFTGVSPGIRVFCEFYEILNTFFHRTPPVAASGIFTNLDFLF